MRKLALALGVGGVASLALAATATDYAIDAKQAMLFGDKAPLAARATASPDESATWAYVPRSPTKKDFRLLAYFHGWEGFVLVDKKGASAKPDWWPGEIGGTRASGLKYGIGAAVEGFPGTVALCPEDGVPDTGKDTTTPDPKDATKTITRHKGPHHANTDSGSFAKADGLAAWIDQCCAHLAALRSSQGAYFASALSSADLHHVYLSGHSAGGKPLAACAASELVRKVPTDLWLLDCTYGWGNKEYPDFCDAMKASLGNAKDKCRLVGIAIKSNGSGTAEDMKKVIAGIKAKGLPVDEVDYASPPDLGAVVTALSTNPIVVIWVGKEDWAKKESWGTFRDCNVPDHDRIPSFFIPILLATAEGKKPSPLPAVPPAPPP
ncbi:MAG TPA: hypothetical protein VFF73_22640 [Planctomycetota bacterium]|nr:hypothetical protein [Planctomycetota bacterium]